ncbi:hypothetical protein [Nostoc sp.]
MSIAKCNLSSLIEELGAVKEQQQPATVELDVARARSLSTP